MKLIDSYFVLFRYVFFLASIRKRDYLSTIFSFLCVLDALFLTELVTVKSENIVVLVIVGTLSSVSACDFATYFLSLSSVC
jgi:energy-coupling factor transporter transmembrane protein EcfT